MTAADELAVKQAIASAENVFEPLEGLVERVADDPTAPFAPDVLKGLYELKGEAPVEFQELRAQLEQMGCQVSWLDEAIAKQGSRGSRDRRKQADTLIGLTADADLFHTADDTAYADLEIDGHRETWPIRGKDFKRWLAFRYFEVEGSAPNSEAQQSALNAIEARAQFGSPQMEVHIRIAGHADKLYLDLADDTWRVVEIDEAGWRVIASPPVRFRRAGGMQPLPAPVRGGSIEMLRPFLNVRSEDDFVLTVSWLLACLRDCGPYPVLVLAGEQGSAKSTLSRILRALVDPNLVPLRALPREDRDLFIAANNGHVLAFDNVSALRGWISDTLCRLATGGGFTVRRLYSDQDEVLFNATRPIILNGIEDFVTRSDLADRTIFLQLEPISEDCRQTEKELWTAFEKVRPQILGALLNAVSAGLRLVGKTQLDCLPRMADFAQWVTACEGAIWEQGTFGRAYDVNRDEAVENVIEDDSVASAIRSYIATRTEWRGTALELLNTLTGEIGDRTANNKSWPANARALSGRLRRAKTFLRLVGIEIAFYREGHARTRMIRISSAPDFIGNSASAPSAPSAPGNEQPVDRASGELPIRTVPRTADATADSENSSRVREQARKAALADGADGADANVLTQSDRWRAKL